MTRPEEPDGIWEEGVVLTKFDARPTPETLSKWATVIEDVQRRYEELARLDPPQPRTGGDPENGLSSAPDPYRGGQEGPRPEGAAADVEPLSKRGRGRLKPNRISGERHIEGDAAPIRHKRWRHKTLGYEVEVLDTRYSGCPTVTVDRTQFARVKRTWNLAKFVLEFEPLGRPMRSISLWDRL